MNDADPTREPVGIRRPVDIRSTGMGSRDFAVRLLQEEKVAAVPGGAFGPSGEGFLRMCFATGFDRIQTAMERTARLVERVRRESGR